MATISQDGLHHRRHSSGSAASLSEVIVEVPENPTELTVPQARVANKEHAKRLTTYTKTAAQVTLGLFIPFYTILDKQDNKILIVASFTSLVFALFLEVLLLRLIDCIEKPKPDCLSCRYEEQMYILIYLSNSLLMLTAMFLLLLCTLKYAYLAAFLILALLVKYSLFYYGKSNHTASVREYEHHDDELNYYSELSARIVIMLFTGLSSFVFASPTLPLNKKHTKVTECFLFVVLIISLLQMLLTTVPPKAQFPSTRIRMVGVVKYLFYAVVSLLTLVGLMATSEILKGIVVFSTFAHILGAMYWFITELRDEHEDPINGDAKLVSEENDNSLTTVFASAAFFALMYVYFQNVDNTEPYKWRNFLLLAVCMNSLCSTFISFLTKMAIFSFALDTRAWSKAQNILSNITTASFVVALFSTILHSFYVMHISK